MIEQARETRIAAARARLRQAAGGMAEAGRAVHGLCPAREDRTEKMSQPTLPKTPEELTAFLIHAGLVRAYGDLASAAWRGRLSNTDIARIEATSVRLIGEAREAAPEFQGFEAEPAVAAAQQQLRELFKLFANARVRQQ